jgi:hypothetical protein
MGLFGPRPLPQAKVRKAHGRPPPGAAKIQPEVVWLWPLFPRPRARMRRRRAPEPWQSGGWQKGWTWGAPWPCTPMCTLTKKSDQLEVATDQAVAACGGDAREAVKALIVANHFLETELEKLRLRSRRAMRDCRLIGRIDTTRPPMDVCYWGRSRSRRRPTRLPSLTLNRHLVWRPLLRLARGLLARFDAPIIVAKRKSRGAPIPLAVAHRFYRRCGTGVSAPLLAK